MYNEILVVDDHPVMARALVSTIEDIAPGAHFRIAGSLAAAVSAVDDLAPDMIVADLSLPDSHGADLVDRLRQVAPLSVLAVCSGLIDRKLALDCLDRGAMAYLSKSDDAAELRRGIQLVMEGKCYLALEALSRHQRHINPSRLVAGSVHTEGLSPRQTEVLHCLLKGFDNNTIADQLKISLPTAKVHVQAVLRHFTVPNRVQLLIRLAHLQATT